MNDEKYVIGFAQCTGADDWRRAMHQEMYRELAFHTDLELIIKDSKSNNDQQIKDIKAFIEQGVDLIIVSPNESEPITPAVEEAISKNIPVIVVDRKTNSSLYNAYVGADNYTIGKIAGTYTSKLLEKGGNVLEIWGLSGSSPAIERHRGFIDVIKGDSSIVIKREVYGNWLREVAKEELKTIFDELKDIDVVYAHNDFMALAAYEIFRDNGLEDKVKIIGVDGLPGPTGGIQLVDENILDATLLYPTGGEKAIEIASKILHGEYYEKENILLTTVIDSSNVRIMKLQAEKLLAQQKDIQRQTQKIDEQIQLYRTQQLYLTISILSFLLVVILGGSVFLALRANKKKNKELEKKNKEILLQRNEIIEFSEKAELATQAKFKFFTNISHEFRTPLTLILASIDDIINKQRLPNKDSHLIRKNAIRLLRLVNQLMDFRKIDNNKMIVHPSENDLVSFTRDIMGAFDRVAAKKKIDFRLIVNKNEIPAYFDRNMLDKVLFNLLSNAFKYTNQGGRIHILLDQLLDDENVTIKVEDNGHGMTPEQVIHAFDRFYQGKNYTSEGTGLGLSLTKEIINLHYGKINVESEKGRGTRFTISLPLKHPELLKLEPELVPADEQFASINEYNKFLIAVEEEVTEEKTGPKLIKERTILLIEDNQDLLVFLESKLNNQYNILKAENGKEGLEIALEQVPDLVISDVMLPEKSGLEIVQHLKDDLRTSHIPAILLTANDEQEQRIAGLKTGADAYISKPFSLNFLFQTIENLLKNRAVLKARFSSETKLSLKLDKLNKLDKQFVNQFIANVEKNIPNQTYGVKDICKELGISRVQLYRKVKALLGYSVSDYIREVRLTKAKHLLLEEELSIAEVAYEVGFTSPAYFSTAFKARFNFSPSDFKSGNIPAS